MAEFTETEEIQEVFTPWAGMTVKEEIGSGTFGTVYRVNLDGSEYAMKHLKVPRSEAEKEELLQKLGDWQRVKEYCRGIVEKRLQEIRLLMSLKGEPNIVSALDYRARETEKGYEVFLLMEYLEPFSDYEITHRMGEADAIRLGVDLCTALEVCERRGILHRDLKPDNILVAEDGAFLVCDFGVAKEPDKTKKTVSVQGTVSYMAPEVYHGKKSDSRADLYAVGMILYRIVNRGREPFVSTADRMVRYKEKEEALKRRMEGEVLPTPVEASEEMAEILRKACAYYPERRYVSAADLKRDLILLQEGRYRCRGKGGKDSGRRTAKDYGRIALIAAGVLLAVVLIAQATLFIYRDRFVNLCDEKIQAKIAEEYGIYTGPRLDGNGVLYINQNSDLYCTLDGEYPWMWKKDSIRKIVFGENVTGFVPLEQERIRNELFNVPSKLINSGRYTSSMVLLMQDMDGRYVSQDCFQRCHNLQEIIIQGNTFWFGSMLSFKDCENLEVIKCPVDAEIIIENHPVLSDTAWIRKEGYRILGGTLFRYNGDREVVDNIPGDIVYIGPEAFKDNVSMTKLVLPDSVRRIGSLAFSGCTHLKQISVGEEVTWIGQEAFQSCSALETFEIPRMASVGANIFSGCESLINLRVSEENPFYTVVDGSLYNKDGSILQWCSPAVYGSFVIPDTVSGVEQYAFTEGLSLTEIVFPKLFSRDVSLTFGKCPNLTSIVLPASLESCMINGSLLCSENGESVSICLRGAEGEIAVPEGIRNIKKYAFYGCHDVTGILLPDTLEYLQDSAFENCTSVTSITLPESLLFVGERVLAGCTSLTDVYYEGAEEDWRNLTRMVELGIEEGKTTVHFGS